VGAVYPPLSCCKKAYRRKKRFCSHVKPVGIIFWDADQISFFATHRINIPPYMEEQVIILRFQFQLLDFIEQLYVFSVQLPSDQISEKNLMGQEPNLHNIATKRF
jgi:hypothetical protein